LQEETVASERTLKIGKNQKNNNIEYFLEIQGPVDPVLRA